ncbi:MAG: WecB/TagA/CpsF family glycosyltransferase [Deinococcales bacterium]|jgi:N-acetylglucosaminyldiphosphoundecaprenol N-acetyl-beta-D-mannosaminyltransferase
MASTQREGASVLGVRVDRTSYAEASQLVASWAGDGAARYVCVANVHTTIVARSDTDFRGVVNAADLVTSDGMPLVWMLRLLGARRAGRVYGPTLMLHICEEAARQGLEVGFYGGTPVAVRAMVTRLTQQFPSLRVSYAFAPPFRELTEAEDAAVVEDVLASGTRILFVGLGCPKQERWMARHRERLPLVQVGVGAAFAFHSGSVRQAPGWLQSLGLEWSFRLAMEPRRLWRRYLSTNPRFVMLALMQLLRLRRFD